MQCSAFTGDKHFTDEQITSIKFLLMPKSCVKYISPLCQIWPQFIQKSSLFYQQSLGMIQTRVTIFLKYLYSLGDKIRATVQLITYTVLQTCLSLFTISQFTVIHISLPTLNSLVRLTFCMRGVT